jgi:serine/threonine protein kinase
MNKIELKQQSIILMATMGNKILKLCEERPITPPRYSLQRKIKPTLFGELWCAEDTKTHTEVAIKITDLQLVNLRPSSIENPIEEVKILGDIPRSDSIANLVESFNHDNKFYTVTEWCNGSELYDVIYDNSLPDKKMIRSLVRGIADIHNAGYAHLDISAENIMVHNGDFKLVDFGMARACTADTVFPKIQGRHFPGKRGYVAPEIYHKRTYNGHKADCYSLGVVLFIMICGTPPYNMDKDGGPLATDERFTLIFTGKLTELLDRWKIKLDPDAVHLLQHLICPPKQRLNIHQVLSHPYLN